MGNSVSGAAGVVSGQARVQKIAPPAPTLQQSANEVGTGRYIPPPPPPPDMTSGSTSQVTVHGITYDWTDNNGVITGSNSNGDTYSYTANPGHPNEHLITDVNGDTEYVKTLTSQNGTAIANYSYGAETPRGKVNMTSSNGQKFTYQGQEITKNGNGQTFYVSQNPLGYLTTWGPLMYGLRGFGSHLTGQGGHDPWATAKE